MMQDLIENHIRSGISIRNQILEQQTDMIEKAALLMTESLENHKKLLFCGNGGSAADAQHIAAELLIRYKGNHTRPSLPALSLAADSSAITAAGNDFGADQIFSRQIEGLGNEGDTLIAITTSGNSQNILNAVTAAKKKKLKVILLTGQNGGKIIKHHSDDLDLSIVISSEETALIQEAHIMIGHILCSLIEKKMFGLG
ncbi:MAG: SIS domain-containing protein [Spirochaetia bacterium]|nr:SIS domain-containing protein [Spirochaetia bacterium]